MRTIAICEDVDRGQNDIKKLRKENDHLKREIWGLRDECEKLEEMLKKVCISANIPEIQLDSFSKSCDEEDDDCDEEDPDEEGEEDTGDNRKKRKSNKNLKASSSGRARRESGTSVQTFDSEVGSYMESMFGLGEVLSGIDQQTEPDITGSVALADGTTDTSNGILKSETGPTIFVDGQNINEPIPTSSTAIFEHAQHLGAPWGHQTATQSDLESVREETESIMNSFALDVVPQDKNPPLSLQQQQFNFEDLVLPDPSTVSKHVPSSVVGTETIDASDGRRTPVIHITPASSPTDELLEISGPRSSDSANAEPNSSTGDRDPDITASENSQSFGCITVVPKTFKVTSEILVSDENEVDSSTKHCGSGTLAESIKTPRNVNDSGESKPHDHRVTKPSDQIFLGTHKWPSNISAAPPVMSSTMPPMSSALHHRSSGICGYCCCTNEILFSGYQSEPSLHSGVATPEQTAQQSPPMFNTLCCRIPPPTFQPVTMRSIWNTVDNNIVIGFYQSFSEGIGNQSSGVTGEPRVQEVIDEVEKQFDPTLEKVLGARIISGRIFISLKNATVVKSFLAHFKNDLVLISRQNQQQIHIHFIEGATTKLTSSLILSGIPQDMSDLAVISVLNQFGQVVAPLKRRKYKGVDISERIAKMYVVENETRLPDYVNVSGYEVRIRVEHDKSENDDGLIEAQAEDPACKKVLRMQIQPTDSEPAKAVPQRKYGFVMIPPTPPVTSTAATPGVSGSILRPHKPITRSSSSAPRLETLVCTLPPVAELDQQHRTNSVCVGNIPHDQLPSKLLEAQNNRIANAQSLNQHNMQPKVTIVPAGPPQTSSTPNLQPAPKKPLARLMVSSPGSFPSSPVSSPGTPGEEGAGQHSRYGFKALYKNLDSRRTSTFDARGHSHLTPSSSYSPRARRKSSVQFADKAKKNSLPWFGCCSWI